MRKARWLHGCGKFILNDRPVLVVTGGSGTLSLLGSYNGHAGDGENHLTSVEYWDLKNEPGWQIGKVLSFGCGGHRMVSSLDFKKTYIIGGYDYVSGYGYIYYNEIQELTCMDNTIDSCEFKLSGTKLAAPRVGFVALPIPESVSAELCN